MTQLPPDPEAPAAHPSTAAAPTRKPRRNWKSLGALGLTLGVVAAGSLGVWAGRETAPSSSDAASAVQVPSGNDNATGGSNSNGLGDNPFGNIPGLGNLGGGLGGSGGGGNGTGSSDGTSGAGTSGGNADIDVQGITERVSPAIVNINTTVSGGSGAGTGMILTPSGEVLTNNHVINGATSISVELSTGATRSAKVLGYDVADDIALIKIQGVSNLPTVSTMSASSVKVGDSVLALGNALGKGGSPTPAAGVVTALNRTITASDQDGSDAETLNGLIQTNAPIQPGDSGGPLFNTDGKVVGVNSAASVRSGFGFRGTTASEGYAITIDKALGIVKQINSNDESDGVHVGDRGILGVSIQRDGTVGGGTRPGNGAAVSGVQADSPAAAAGIQAGDTIVSVSGTTVSSASQLSTVMGGYHPGDKVSVTWVDAGGQRHTASITLIPGPPA